VSIIQARALSFVRDSDALFPKSFEEDLLSLSSSSLNMMTSINGDVVVVAAA